MSGETSDDHEFKRFIQIIRWIDRHVEIEVDPQHAEIVLRELGL